LTLLIVFAINGSFKSKVKLSIFMIDALDQSVWSLHYHRKMSADKNAAAKDLWQAGCCKVGPQSLPGQQYRGLPAGAGKRLSVGHPGWF
jgi:hypothetical protein